MASLNLSDKERGLFIKLAILVIVLYGLVWAAERYSKEYTSVVSAKNNELAGELSEYRARLSEINEEEVLQSQYVETYNGYQQRNLILGPEIVENEALIANIVEENRVFLLEKLQQVKEERRFFDLGYDLSKPSDLPASFSELTSNSSVAVRANIMELKMPLLHSLDLLMLLNDFYDDTLNRFTPVRCTLTFTGNDRTGVQSSLLELRKNIESECRLVWLSVYDPQQGKDATIAPDTAS